MCEMRGRRLEIERRRSTATSSEICLPRTKQLGHPYGDNIDCLDLISHLVGDHRIVV